MKIYLLSAFVYSILLIIGIFILVKRKRWNKIGKLDKMDAIACISIGFTPILRTIVLLGIIAINFYSAERLEKVYEKREDNNE